MSLGINDINALDPWNQLLTIENSINELFNLLKDFNNNNALKKSKMKKSSFLKDVESAKRLIDTKWRRPVHEPNKYQQYKDW